MSVPIDIVPRAIAAETGIMRALNSALSKKASSVLLRWSITTYLSIEIWGYSHQE
jgi:hypothetical protein